MAGFILLTYSDLVLRHEDVLLHILEITENLTIFLAKISWNLRHVQQTWARGKIDIGESKIFEVGGSSWKILKRGAKKFD